MIAYQQIDPGTFASFDFLKQQETDQGWYVRVTVIDPERLWRLC